MTENESFGDLRKTLSDQIDPPDLQVNKLTESVDVFLQCKLAVRNDTKGTSCTGKWDVTLNGPLFTLSSLPAKNRLNTIMFDFGEWYLCCHPWMTRSVERERERERSEIG